jgi:hypothetical protein
MRKATARALKTSAAVAQGVELAALVSATAVEAMRARRDPAVIAEKRRRAARRRLSAWSAGAIVSGAVTATGTAAMFQGDHSSGAIGALVFLVAVLIWCVLGVVKAARDLRTRTRVIAALPAASPTRPAVAGEIRPIMARLDGYSDGLRQLVGMIGIVDDDPGVRTLRDEILEAADASEARLRRQAVDVTGLIKARRVAPPAAGVQLDAAVGSLQRQISDGVAGYGELVSAASEAVTASQNLADRAGQQGRDASSGGGPSAVGGSPHPELDQPIDHLRSLAAGMRELTEG